MGAVDVHHLVRGGEHDNPQRRKARLCAHPLNDFEAIGKRHFEVQQKQIRQRKLGSVSVLSLSLEVGDGFGAVLYPVEQHGHSHLLEGSLQQQDVRFTVFGEQYDWRATVGHKLGLSSYLVRTLPVSPPLLM